MPKGRFAKTKIKSLLSLFLGITSGTLGVGEQYLWSGKRRDMKGEKRFVVSVAFPSTIKGETYYSGLSAVKLKP